jgi:hypothetical protein
MGTRMETQEKSIDTCDVCGEDILKAHPDDAWDNTRATCAFCGKLLCRGRGCDHYVSAPQGWNGGVDLCTTCWLAGEEERADLEAVTEKLKVAERAARGEGRRLLAAWKAKAVAAPKRQGGRHEACTRSILAADRRARV